MKKRILAVTLVLCMLLPMIPFASLAAIASADVEASEFWRDVTFGDVPLDVWYRSKATDVGFGDETVTDYATFMKAFDKMIGFGDINADPFVFTDDVVTAEITDLKALWPDDDNRYDDVAESVKAAMNKTIGNGYITREVIGQATSTADRGINVLQYLYAYTLDPTEELGYVGPTNLPKIIICAGTQSDEVGAIFGMYYLISEMLKDDGSDPVLSYLRHNVKLVLVPCLSPGGINKATYWNANGVNLNRNYHIPSMNSFKTGIGGYDAAGNKVRDGRYNADGSAADSYQRTGYVAFDQAETCAMRDVFEEHADAFYYVDFHTNSHTITSYNSTTQQYEVNWENANWYSLNALRDSYFARLYDAANWQLDRVNKYFREDYFAAYGVDDDTRIGKVTVGTSGKPASGTMGTGTGTSQRYAYESGMLATTLEGITGVFARGTVAGKPTDAQLNGSLNMDSYSFGAQKMCSEELANWLMAVLGVYANDGDLPSPTYSSSFVPSGENFPIISALDKETITGAYDTDREKYPNKNESGYMKLEELSAYGAYTVTYQGGWELGYKLVNADGSLKTGDELNFTRFNNVYFYDSNFGGGTDLKVDGTYGTKYFRETYLTDSTWMKNNHGGFGLGGSVLTNTPISTANVMWSGYHANTWGGWSTAATIRYTAEYTGDITIDITNIAFSNNTQVLEIRRNGELVGTLIPTKDMCKDWLNTETGKWVSGGYNYERPGAYSVSTSVTKGDVIEFVARTRADVTAADAIDGTSDTNAWKKGLCNYRINVGYYLAYKDHVDADYTGETGAVTVKDIPINANGSRAGVLQLLRWYKANGSEVGYSYGTIPTDGYAKINSDLFTAGIISENATWQEALAQYRKYLLTIGNLSSSSGWLPGALDNGSGTSTTAFSPFYVRNFLYKANLFGINKSTSNGVITCSWKGNQTAWTQDAAQLVTKAYYEKQLDAFFSAADLISVTPTGTGKGIQIPLESIDVANIPTIAAYNANDGVLPSVVGYATFTDGYYGTLMSARGRDSQTVAIAYTVPAGAKGNATLLVNDLHFTSTATFTWSLHLNGTKLAGSSSAIAVDGAVAAINTALATLGGFAVKEGDLIELRFKNGSGNVSVAPNVSLDIDSGNGEAAYRYSGKSDAVTVTDIPTVGSGQAPLMQLLYWYKSNGSIVSYNHGEITDGYAKINPNLITGGYIDADASWDKALEQYGEYLRSVACVSSASGWLPGALDNGGGATSTTEFSPFLVRSFLSGANLFGITKSSGKYLWRGNQLAWSQSAPLITKALFETQLTAYFSAKDLLTEQPTGTASTLQIPYASLASITSGEKSLPNIVSYDGNVSNVDSKPAVGYGSLTAGSDYFGTLMGARAIGSQTVAIAYVVPKDTVGTATLSLDSLYLSSTATFSWSLTKNGVKLVGSSGNIAADGAQAAIATALETYGSFDIKAGDIIELRFTRGSGFNSFAPGVTLNVKAEKKTETAPLRRVQLSSGGAVLSDDLAVIGKSVADLITAYNAANGTRFAANGCYVNGVWYDKDAELPAVGVWDVVIDDLKIEASASISIGATYSINVYLPALDGATAAGVKVNGENLPATLTGDRYKVTVSTDYAKDLLDREVTYTPYYVIDGKEAVSAKTFTTTAAELLEAYIAGVYTAEAQALAQAALDYATVAKAYFAGETADAATLARLAQVNVTGEDKTVNTAGEQYTFNAATLQIGNTVNFILAVGNTDGTALTTLDGVDVKLNGTTVTPSHVEAGAVGGRRVMVLIFEGVPESEFENSQTFTVGDAELVYSVKDYCVRTIGSAAEAEANMIRALYALGVAAEDYEGTTASTPITASTYAYDSELISYLGRTAEEDNARMFRNTASGFEVTFYGKKLVAEMSNLGRDAAVMAVLLDGETDPTAINLDLTKDCKNGKLVIAEFDKAGMHTVRVQKVTEESISVASLRSLTVEDGGLLPTEKKNALRLVAYGDSITCGYGNMRLDASVDGLYSATQNGLMTYSALAAAMLGAEYEAFSRSGIGLYTNAYNMSYNMLDVYDYVSPMSDGSKKWDMAENAPDIVVINLGTNDLVATEDKADSVPDGMPFYSHDGIRAAYVEFVEKLNDAYGKGVVYFLVGGMMTNSTDTAMQEAVAILQAEGINASTVVLPSRAGYGGHPMLDVHEAAAKVLYDAIVEAYEA